MLGTDNPSCWTLRGSSATPRNKMRLQIVLAVHRKFVPKKRTAV
jgi:hypothetical protein